MTPSSSRHGPPSPTRCNIGIDASVSQSFFKEIEDPTEWLGNEHVDVYLHLVCKQKRDPVECQKFPHKVAVLDIAFFWVITIYDSTVYKLLDNPKYKEQQVLPLRRLFPLICNASNYFVASKRKAQKLNCMKAVRLAPTLFPCQHDGNSCGVFMVKGIEYVMMNKNVNFNFNQDNIPEFRKQMARDIFANWLHFD
ncbi:hypothetical protein Ddye_023662 [Dipteronia dyeriana]|uniref:Ubiquitin-like protease family profile domain-containing protein n=1 Tax=Dipteronia dyeriana TaxID=168575 RepID=A0AAD9TUC2_9ROSI|nr:hypothetical protein Ddye_023662 [Dipteronia dyeriana]